MLLILEGPDGSGKTTLFNKLCNDFDCYPLKSIDRDFPIQKDFYDTLFNYCSNTQKIYVLDRCFISEIVYRIIMEDKQPNIMLKDMVDLFTKYERSIVYVFCDTDNAFENAKTRGETYIVELSKHIQIRNAYNIVFGLLKKFTYNKIIKYDYEYDDISTIFDLLKED